VAQELAGATANRGVDLDAYVDDRSDPIAVLRSYVNAVNRREYARAYSYWDAGAAAAMLPPYPEFARGYAETRAVRLTTGPVRSDPGAGQLSYGVPALLVAGTTAGETRTFVGCYELRAPRPDAQKVPPFRPMSIWAATIREVAGELDPSRSLTGECASGRDDLP
jgi:hypothetical protein